MSAFDLVVLGGGVAGIAAAERAASLGASVALVVKGRFGGAMREACVRALARSAEIAHTVRRAPRFGVTHYGFEVDLAAIMEQKDRSVGTVVEHWERSLATSRIAIRRGTARLDGPGQVRVGDELIAARRVVIATGSRPLPPRIPGLAAAGYLTSEGILSLRRLPTRLVVLGGGRLALELAQAFARFGSRVTVLERSPRLLGEEDDEVSALVERALREEGLVVRTGADVRDVEAQDGSIVVRTAVAGVVERAVADGVLVVGERAPNVEHLGLDSAGIAVDRGGVVVDGELRTTAVGVWAAGDVTGGPLFSDVAAHQGAIAASNAVSGDHERSDDDAVPRVARIDPEVASLGLSELRAVAAGHAVRVVRIPYARVGRARRTDLGETLVKVVADRATRRVLGLHVVGPGAAEIVQRGRVAMRSGVTRPGLTTDALLGLISVGPTPAIRARSAGEATGAAALLEGSVAGSAGDISYQMVGGR